MKCQLAVSGRERRTSSAQLAMEAIDWPGPRMAATRARAAGVSWASAIRATRLCPSGPHAKVGRQPATTAITANFRMQLSVTWRYAQGGNTIGEVRLLS